MGELNRGITLRPTTVGMVLPAGGSETGVAVASEMEALVELSCNLQATDKLSVCFLFRIKRHQNAEVLTGANDWDGHSLF